MRIGIVAGERSGDLLGAGLIRALTAQTSEVHIEAVAGPAMQAEGCEVLADAERLSVMGLIEPLKVLPDLLRLQRTLLDRWMAEPPDVVVGIDSPDFNLRLERRLRRAGIRTVHYVSPTVWAWRPGRIKTIRAAADLVLCLFPFEKRFYDGQGVRAEFVGHPMVERLRTVPNASAARQALAIGDGRVVAVLPGSRASEVSRLGPVFAGAVALLAGDARTADVSFVCPAATPRLRAMLDEQFAAAGIAERVRLLEGRSAEVLSAADVALLASGTAALEAALLATPMVAAYRVAPLTYLIAKTLRLVKTPYMTLPNLLTETPLVPEFKQGEASPQALAQALADLLGDAPRCEHIRSQFAGLATQLSRDGDRLAAAAVLDLAGWRAPAQ